MIDRRWAIVEKMEELRKLNPNLRYQIRLGKSDFRLLSKNYKSTEYTRWRDVALSVIDPLDEFPRPSKNHQPNIEESHARLIADAVQKAKDVADRRNNSEWSTAGKRLLSPEKVKRNLRKKLSLPVKINADLQRIICGQKILDLGEIGIEDDDIEVVQPAVPQPDGPSPSAPPMEEASEVSKDEVNTTGEVTEENSSIVNLGACCSTTK